MIGLHLGDVGTNLLGDGRQTSQTGKLAQSLRPPEASIVGHPEVARNQTIIGANSARVSHILESQIVTIRNISETRTRGIRYAHLGDLARLFGWPDIRHFLQNRAGG